MLKTLYKLPVIFLLISGSAFAATEPVKTSLGAYFTSQQIKNIQNYKSSFDKSVSAKELADVYRKSILLSENLNEKIGEIENPELDKYKWLTKHVPGMKLVYGAEGTSMFFATNYTEFLVKAKKTPQVSDDTFFSLMSDIYEKPDVSHPKWFATTDGLALGSYSQLGKGYHIKGLNQINLAMQKSPEFTKELKDSLLSDVIESNHYGIQKSLVVSEINQMINDKYLTNAQKVQLKNRINQINKPTKGINLQFNCEKSECIY